MKINRKIKAEISNKIISLFQHKRYEKYVLDMMNLSKKVFPGEYREIVKQSNGEADYYEIVSNKIFDAKLPFNQAQIELLTDGEKHKPNVLMWLSILYEESTHMDIQAIRNNEYDIKQNKLYSIMYDAIKDEMKNDENIVFFIPFPIGHVLDGALSETSDCLDEIYEALKKEKELNYLLNRDIYLICPTGISSDSFILRNIGGRIREKIEYTELEEFFKYEET